MSDVLLHYTNQAGLVGILRSATLWHTDYRFTNDAHEIIKIAEATLFDGFKLIADTKYAEHPEQNREHGARKAAKDYVGAMEDWQIFLLALSKPSDPYDAENGSLSMWRAYGNSRNRYALVFDYETITKGMLDEDKRQGFASLVDNMYYHIPFHIKKSLCEKFDFARFLEMNLEMSGKAGKSVLSKKDSEDIMSFILSCKHYGFHEEKEFRHAILFSGEEKLDKLYEARRDYPTIPISFDKKCLKGIIIGPNSDEERSRALIEYYQRAYGWPEIDIKKSTIPFVE